MLLNEFENVEEVYSKYYRLIYIQYKGVCFGVLRMRGSIYQMRRFFYENAGHEKTIKCAFKKARKLIAFTCTCILMYTYDMIESRCQDQGYRDRETQP